MIRCALSSDPVACFWGLLPLWAQLGLVACVLLIIAGIGWRLVVIAKQFGGWPAAVGAIGIVGILVGVFWPRKVDKALEPTTPPMWPHEDPPMTKVPKKKRPTIFDR